MTIAGLEGDRPVVCSRNVVIKPDVTFAAAIKNDYDVVVCPGGMKGAEHLASVRLWFVELLAVTKSNFVRRKCIWDSCHSDPYYQVQSL